MTTLPDDPLDRISHLAHTERGALAALARGEGLAPEDAVDCVQEGLCTMLDLAQRGELPADPAPWGAVLATIVRNAARNRRRLHANARPHDALDDAPPLAADDAAADDVLARAEEHVRLRACV